MANESILLVDDDELMLGLCAEILEIGGYKVTSFKCGLDAFYLFQQDASKFDLLITDYNMPKITGGELAVNILEIRNDLPIILVTGCHHVTDSNLHHWGIDAMLRKPYRVIEIISLVRNVLTCPSRGSGLLG